MLTKTWHAYCIVWFCLLPLVSVTSYFEGKDLNEYLLSNYTRTLPPRLQLDDPIFVNVDLIVGSIIDFDIVSGIVTFVGSFFISWEDEVIKQTWNNSRFNNISATQFNMNDIWIPKAVIRNTANTPPIFEFKSIFDMDTTRVTVLKNGTASLASVSVHEATCMTDVSYYPFDDHLCEIEVTSYNTFMNVLFSSENQSTSNMLTRANSEWHIRMSVQVKKRRPNVVFRIYLLRKPQFLLVNLGFPILLIGIVNSLLFLIPTESGERLSFGVSLFLTNIVFLATVLEKLPQTEQISYFNAIITMQLSYGSVMIFCLVISLGLYHYCGPMEVPTFLRRLSILILPPRHAVKTSTKIKPVVADHSSAHKNNCNGKNKNVNALDSLSKNDVEVAEEKLTPGDEPQITWKHAARAVDRLCNITNFLFCLCVLLFLISIGTHRMLTVYRNVHTFYGGDKVFDPL